jgi:hypothetical protein
MSAGEAILTDGLKELVWDLVPRQSAPETRANGGAVVTFGRPVWAIRARYEGMSQDSLRALLAWIGRRQGARVTFTAWDPVRKTPMLAPGQINDFLDVSAISVINSTVTLTGMESTVISPGDMVGFYTATSGYWVGQATASVSPSGGASTIPVEPYPQTPHASTPNARLLRALGEFQLSGRPDISASVDRRYSVSFDALQVVRV